VLFVAAFPVHAHFDISVLHIVEDLFHGMLGDELADAHLFGGRGWNEDQRVIVQNPQMDDSEAFPVIGFNLDVFDDAKALIGINDSIANLK
jgi:hypothetical protein